MVIRHDGGGNVEQRHRQCRNAKDAVRYVPCCFITYGPWQTKAGMPVKGQSWGNHSRKNDDDGDDGCGEDFFSTGREGENTGFCQHRHGDYHKNHTDIKKSSDRQRAGVHFIRNCIGEESEIFIKNQQGGGGTYADRTGCQCLILYIGRKNNGSKAE